MDILDFTREQGGWIATILAAIIGGVFGLFKIFGHKNTQIIKNVKDSNIQQSNGSINTTIIKDSKNKKE